MAGATATVGSAATVTDSDKSDLQATEVASVKSAFPNRCRVMLDVGGYKSVITVQPEDLDVTIKFQLSAAYPSDIPQITIRSESLLEEKIMELQNSLRSKAQSLLGNQMIQPLIKEAEHELYNLGLRRGKTTNINAHTFIGKKPQKQRKPKKKPRSEDEEVESKLPSMKTADDVVKRIIWDDSLEKDDFTVGYIDRFRGLVEKYFSAFSWEDLASVEYDVLAVPKHRIQYFKYKDIIVWDKVKRIDNVFGSASGTKTIDVVIKEAQEAEQRKKDGATATSTEADEPKKDNTVSDEYSTSDETDDEDDIVVTIGSSAGIGVQSSEKKTGENQTKEGDEFDPYWENKLRPNYFLCVRITDAQVADRICNVQDHLMEVDPLFAECCIPGVSLHMTICTLGLDTADQLQHCIDTLKKIKPELQSVLPKSLINLEGVSNFYNRVIYAQVHYEEDFMKFCNLLKLLLREAGVQIRDGYQFVPHVTIMKTTRPVSRLRGTKKIEYGMYEKFVNEKFGQQKIDSIYLCSMGTERRDDGFYFTPAEIHFDEQ